MDKCCKTALICGKLKAQRDHQKLYFFQPLYKSFQRVFHLLIHRFLTTIYPFFGHSNSHYFVSSHDKKGLRS